MDEILGISLSQEELLAALLIAALPAPVGFDDLETWVFSDLPEEVRSPLLAAAERSLIAHGFLLVDPAKVTLEEFVSTVLRTCTQPERTWLILHQPAGQPERATYFHQAGQHYLAHVETAGIHQFLQLGGSQDVIDTAIQLVVPLNNHEEDSLTGTLAESIFAALARTSSRSSLSELCRQLTVAGLNAKLSLAFAETFNKLVSITAFARFNHPPQAELQRAFTVVRGENAQWILTLLSPGTLQLKSINGEVLTDVLRDFG